MNPCLAQYDVRHLRQIVLNILDAVSAHDPGPVLRRTPKCNLVDPIRFFDDLLGEPEGLKHLNGSAGDPIGLPDLKRSSLAFGYMDSDVRKLRELGGECQSRGSASDDKNVDILSPPWFTNNLFSNGWVARAKSFKMELHRRPRSFSPFLLS